MAVLPSADSAGAVGIEIVTVADNSGTDAAKTGLAGLDAESKSLSSGGLASLSSSLKDVGSQMTAVGSSMSKYITLPIVGIAAASVKMAMDFQQSMELLHTNAGVPQAAIASLSNEILALAGVVGQSPDSLATAFYHIATAGQGIYSTAQELDQLKTAAEGAAIGQASLDDTTYALTSTMNSNVIGTKTASETMGTLLGIVQSGDMHLSDMNDVISTGLMGTLSTFGVSLQSAGAALADFGDLGEKGAIAGTRLRMMMTLMASPSAAAAKILGDLGLSTSDAANATGQMNAIFAQTGLTTTRLADDLRQPNGIYVAITDLKTSLEKTGMSASQTDTVLAKAFGGGRTDAALLQLLDTTGRLDLKYQQIGSDSGNFANNWVAQQQTMKQQWDKAWSGIQADMIRIGVVIMPEVTHAMTDIGNAVSSVTNWFTHLSAGQKQFVIDAAIVAAAVGPILVVFGTLAKSISNIINLASSAASGLRLINTAVSGASVAGEVSAIASISGALAAAITVGSSFISTMSNINSVIGAQTKQLDSSIGKEIATLRASGHTTQANQLQAQLNQVNNGPGFPFNLFASGTNYAPGGWSVVGENGPELINMPSGSQVKTNNQSNGLTGSGSSTTVSIGTVYIANPAAAQTFFNQLNQDIMNIGKGLTMNQGIN